MKIRLDRVLSIVSIICSVGPVQAQNVDGITTPVSFSAISVKPSADGVNRALYKFTGDSILDVNNTVATLISIAYGLQDSRALTGLPKWALEEKFDVEAKVEPEDMEKFAGLSAPQKSKLLQSVLLERFGLKFHFETRSFPGWALVASKQGSKLTPAPLPQGEGSKKVWKITGQYQLEAENVTIAELCRMLLSTEAQSLTIDQTGLPGTYNLTLSWHRDGQNENGDVPDIFTAVKEQLGLQLVPKQLPETVLVVDEIRRPTPN